VTLAKSIAPASSLGAMERFGGSSGPGYLYAKVVLLSPSPAISRSAHQSEPESCVAPNPEQTTGFAYRKPENPLRLSVRHVPVLRKLFETQDRLDPGCESPEHSYIGAKCSLLEGPVESSSVIASLRLRLIRDHFSRARSSFRSDSRATVDQERSSIGANSNWTIRPQHTNRVEPLLQLGPKAAGARVLDRPELIHPAEGSKEGNRFMSCSDKHR
jgi:hypothetical protein